MAAAIRALRAAPLSSRLTGIIMHEYFSIDLLTIDESGNTPDQELGRAVRDVA